jgi:phage-related protein
MSKATYSEDEDDPSKPVIWLHGEIKTPPFSTAARTEAGVLIRMLQDGINLGMPHSRPMPSIGKRCHELRVTDRDKIWRVFYRIDRNAILILGVVLKKTNKTEKHDIDASRTRIKAYDDAVKSAEKERRHGQSGT